VVELGTNDLGAGKRRPAAVELWLSQLVQRAHAAGVRVMGMTIPPLANAGEPPDPDLEARRQALNGGIRSHGPAGVGFDAVVDMDAALRDPRHPGSVARRYAGCGFGDCAKWHPGPAGHRAVAAAFDLAVLKALAGGCPTGACSPGDRATS
jgi:hypothetical protein